VIATLLSFLGGTAFRMLWGEISSWLTKRQDHAQELDRMRFQAEADAAQHLRNMESIRLQSELGVKTIQVQGDADMARREADAWGAAVESVGRQSGIFVVDLWNGVIRPLVATVCIGLWILHTARAGWVLDEQGWSILGAALGLYLADRTLTKRGK
jgi:hypothetical protein